MTLIGDTAEEDREIFAAMKAHTRKVRQDRKANALDYLERVKSLVDDGKVTIDPNGTWNWKLLGRSGQYWPTKGRWQYTSAKLIADAKRKAIAKGARHGQYSYATRDTQFGGGIKKFIDWLERNQ